MPIKLRIMFFLIMILLGVMQKTICKDHLFVNVMSFNKQTQFVDTSLDFNLVKPYLVLSQLLFHVPLFYYNLQLHFREGLKKVIFITLGLDPPPPRKWWNFFQFFLDTRPLFENFLKKMFFSPLKSQNFQKRKKMTATHSTAHNVGCPPHDILTS